MLMQSFIRTQRLNVLIIMEMITNKGLSFGKARLSGSIGTGHGHDAMNDVDRLPGRRWHE